MRAVIGAPAIMPTLLHTALCALTVDLIQPDLTCAWTVLVGHEVTYETEPHTQAHIVIIQNVN